MEAQRKAEDVKRKREADEKRRERAEEKLAKQRIKEKIERDRLERKARNQPVSDYSHLRYLLSATTPLHHHTLSLLPNKISPLFNADFLLYCSNNSLLPVLPLWQLLPPQPQHGPPPRKVFPSKPLFYNNPPNVDFFLFFSQIQFNEHSIQSVEWRIAKERIPCSDHSGGLQGFPAAELRVHPTIWYADEFPSSHFHSRRIRQDSARTRSCTEWDHHRHCT